jgi:hypothetical protein
MPRRTRNQLVAAAGTVLLGSSASWLLTMQKAHSTVEQEVANGWPVEANATPATLAGDARSRYSLSPDSTYASETSSDGQWRGIVPGVATEADEPRSRWAVFTTTQVLSVEECTSWVARAEALELEDGDFIFATGESGQLTRLATGARRHSSTRLIDDEEFARTMQERLAGQVPEALADGRRLCIVEPSFLQVRTWPVLCAAL